MKDKILFSEQQKLTQPWLWIVLSGMPALFLWGMIRQIGFGRPFGDEPMSNLGLVMMFVLTLVVLAFLGMMRLDTVITKEGISIKYFPLHRSFRHYRWNEVSKVLVMKHSVLGSRGMRYKRLRGSHYGKVYNVFGNKGLQIELTNRRLLLIGTQRAEEIEAVLHKIEALNEKLTH